MTDDDDRERQAVAGEGTHASTARRLLVARLREESAMLESAEPSDPWIDEARGELRALTLGK